MKSTIRMTGALTALALAAAGTAVATTTGASAAGAGRTILAGHLVSPLSAAITTTGTAYVSQDFAGSLVKIRPGHAPRTIYHAPKGTSVSGVSVRKGVATFATGPLIKQRSKSGSVSTLINLGAYEKKHNPDSGVTYGFRTIKKGCASKFPKGFPVKYNGEVDSNPYATESGFGSLWVADAGGTDIVRVENGKVTDTILLPAVPIKITAKVAKAQHVPACAVGLTYWFEPVPTDVEAAHGQLYVSTLTGGPEDNSLGKKSRIYTISPVNADPTLLAKGFAGATGLAVTPGGDVYVAELFGGQISKVRDGSSVPHRWRGATQPAAVEFMKGKVYATTNALAKTAIGRLVRFGG